VAAKGAGLSALPQNVSDPNDQDYEEIGYEQDTVGSEVRATPLIHSRRNRAGETLLFGYDALGRMTLKDRPGSEPDIAYTYDNRGLQLSASYPSTGETASSGYDNAGRLTSSGVTAGGVTRMIGYGWDADGNRQSMTYPDTFVVTYVNDGLDRMSELHDGVTTALLAAYTYDPLGRRQGITRSNSSSTAYGYDGASRLTSLAHHFFNPPTT
jgi:YD repeat-containing protein